MPRPNQQPSYLSVAVNGAAIRLRRVELGETLVALASRVPMSFTYLSDVELGRRPSVSPKMFGQLREALGIPANRADEIKAVPVAATARRQRRAA